jgi:iron(III) transport system ATP-binding protein|tara:strand:- start:2265 stop:2912 length:648 start_codon:yes stop_codon:yes gene_type:complete
VNNILEISNLSHAYSKDSKSVTGINLNILSGERVSILGPSGCGKSTLLRLIAGLERPSEGEIKIKGIEVSSKESLVPPEKRNVGLVVQDKALFPHLSVYANICFGIKKNKTKDDIASELLNLFKIEDLKNKYPHEISGGEQQRVALARSLATDPDVLMLDEPFSALDKELKQNIYSEISAVFSEKKSTILLVTHDQNEAELMTERRLIMEKGSFV